MSKATEHRKRAAEHARLAALITNHHGRKSHRQMEQLYLVLAENADWLNAINNPTASSSQIPDWQWRRESDRAGK